MFLSHALELNPAYELEPRRSEDVSDRVDDRPSNSDRVAKIRCDNFALEGSGEGGEEQSKRGFRSFIMQREMCGLRPRMYHTSCKCSRP